MQKLESIKEWIDKEKYDDAQSALDEYVSSPESLNKDEAYYLYGNICRKKSDWQGALNNYRHAADLNPKSPAVHAYRSILDILNFYNKDMYNQ